MVLWILFLKVSLLLFQVNTCRCQLLSKLFDINSAHRKPTRHGRIRPKIPLKLWRPRLRHHITPRHRNSTDDLRLLMLQPLNLLLTKLLELLKLTLQLSLLVVDSLHTQFRIIPVYLNVFNLLDHLKSLLKFDVLSDRWMFVVIFAEEWFSRQVILVCWLLWRAKPIWCLGWCTALQLLGHPADH